MSVSSEVRRTLVKSPPELWAELSDPLALARHLDELGQIRITGTIPERIVDWEAASAHGAETTGRIEIEPSGWGTRVTLSASRQIPSSGPDPAAEATSEPAVGEPDSEPSAAQQPQPPEAVSISQVAPLPEPQPAEPAPVSQPEAALENALSLETEIVASEPLKTFWARLFRRRRGRPQPEQAIKLRAPVEAESAVQPEPDATADEEPRPAPAPEPTRDPAAEQPQPAPAPDLAAELAELEQQTMAVLTGVLDRLGAAHHRPFSRA
jgi:hypothetical protein